MSVIISLSFWLAFGQNCNEAIDGLVNGCSIPFGMDFFYKERFKSACNKHDHCYNCVRVLLQPHQKLHKY